VLHGAILPTCTRFINFAGAPVLRAGPDIPAIHVADWDFPVHGSNHRSNSVSEPLPHRRLHQGQKRVVVVPYKRH
jgi:hypothetical protein